MMLMGAGSTAGASFDPLSLSPVVWFKADALSLNDGDPVGTWSDSSGNGRNATQGTASAKPTYKTGILNGKPVVRFDGTDDVLDTAAASALIGVNYSLFVVAKYSAGAPSTRAVFGQGGSGGLDVLQIVGWQNSTNWMVSHFSDDGTIAATPDQNWHYYTVTHSSGSTLRTNGVATGSSVNPANHLGGTNVMRVGGSSAWSPWLGDIAEIIAYASVLSNANRDSVEAYLASKYGL